MPARVDHASEGIHLKRSIRPAPHMFRPTIGGHHTITQLLPQPELSVHGSARMRGPADCRWRFRARLRSLREVMAHTATMKTHPNTPSGINRCAHLSPSPAEALNANSAVGIMTSSHMDMASGNHFLLTSLSTPAGRITASTITPRIRQCNGEAPAPLSQKPSEKSAQTAIDATRAIRHTSGSKIFMADPTAMYVVLRNPVTEPTTTVHLFNHTVSQIWHFLIAFMGLCGVDRPTATPHAT